MLVLNILSGLAYSVFWFYKNWRDLALHAEHRFQEAENLSGTDFALRKFKDISPLLRTVGILVPVWQAYLTYRYFSETAQLLPDAASFPRRHPHWAAVCLLATFIACLCLASLPGAFYLLFVLAAVPLAVNQYWLNQYWRSQNLEQSVVRQAFSAGELVLLVLGAICWGLVVTGFAVH